MIYLYILLFAFSCLLLALASKALVDSLANVALYLRIREFIVSFFVIAFGVSIPNLVVGVISALQGMPELSLGDVLGGNIVDLSLAVGLAGIFSLKGIPTKSRTMQASSLATIFFALLPLLLMSDGVLSRLDGGAMIVLYIFYIYWLFSKRERFERPFAKGEKRPKAKMFVKSVGMGVLGLFFLLLGGWGVVQSATQFSAFLNLPLAMVGLFIVSIGNCLPEIIFSIQAARKGEDWMILGDLMGGVIFCAVMVQGLVALISPITISQISFSVVARFFLVAICLLFLYFVQTDRKITKKESVGLVFIYIAFLISEIMLKNIVE